MVRYSSNMQRVLAKERKRRERRRKIKTLDRYFVGKSGVTVTRPNVFSPLGRVVRWTRRPRQGDWREPVALPLRSGIPPLDLMRYPYLPRISSGRRLGGWSVYRNPTRYWEERTSLVRAWIRWHRRKESRLRRRPWLDL